MTKTKTKKCSYINCTINSQENQSKRFFLFPSNEERAKVWIAQCGNDKLNSLTHKTLSHTTYICEDHFSNKDYARIISPFKKKLKNDSIPINYHVMEKRKSPCLKIIKPKSPKVNTPEVSQHLMHNLDSITPTQHNKRLNVSIFIFTNLRTINYIIFINIKNVNVSSSF